MSWWENLWNGYVSSFKSQDTQRAQNVTSGFGAGGGTVPIAQWGEDNRTLADANLGAVSLYARGLAATSDKVGKALYVPYSYGVARPLTTAMLLMDSQDYGGTSLDIRRAWNDSEFVSPGQEIVAGFNSGQLNTVANILTGSDNTGTFGRQGEGSPREQVNRAIGEKRRLNNFENNGWANFTSGASDAVFNFMLDPSIAALKGVKVAKINQRAADVAAEAEQVANRAGGLWERLKWVADEGTNAAMVDEWLQGSNPALAGLLAETRDVDTAATVWMAARGNADAITRLRAESASTAAGVEAARNALGFANLSGMPVKGIYDKIDELNDLIARDDLLRKALQEKSSYEFVRKTTLQDGLVTVSRDARKEADRIFNDELDYTAKWGLLPTRYQRNSGVRPVTVWSAATGEKPSGYYALAGSGVDDGARELASELNTKLGRKVLTPEQRVGFFSRYTTAESQVQRLAVLEDVERAFFEQIGLRRGMGDTEVRKAYEAWRAGKGQAVQEVARGNGKWVDQMGEIHAIPMLSTQVDDTFFMPAWDEIDKVLADTARERAKSAGDLAPRLKAITGDFVLDVGNSAAKGYDNFMLLWRPAVLFRLGYPTRNVSEGWLRFASVAGPLAATRGTKEGIKSWAKNRRLGRTARMFGVNPDSTFASYMDEMDGLIARGKELDDDLLEAAGDVDAVAAIEREAAQLRSRLAVVEDYIRQNKHRSGVKSGVFDGIEYPGVFAGVDGYGTRVATSESRTTLADVTGPGAYLSGNRSYTGDWVLVNPTDARFPEELANLGNKQFRNSGIMQRLLAGQSDAEVEAWLFGQSNEAAYERARLQASKLGGVVSRAQARRHVQVHKDTLNRYFADPNLRALLRDRELTPDDVRAAMEASGLPRLTPEQLKGLAKARERNRQLLSELNDELAQASDPRIKARIEDDIARLQYRAKKLAGDPYGGDQTAPFDALHGTSRRFVDDAVEPGPAAGVAADRRIVHDWLGDMAPGADNYWQPIHGREIEEVIGSNRTKASFERARKLRDRVYHYIGTLPTDTLLRHPFTSNRYNEYMRAAIANAGDQGRVLTQADLDQMTRQARRFATRETKRTLYTIERYTSAAEVMRFVSPFFAAWENTAKTWLRIAGNDPSIVLRGAQLATAPVRGGLVVDEEGNPVEWDGQILPDKDWYMTFQVPQWVADKVPGLRDYPTIGISPKSLNTVLQGEQWWQPGFGPTIQMPLSEIAKRNTEEVWAQTIEDWVLTNGASEKPLSWDQLIPASWKRLVTYNSPDSREFATTQLNILRQMTFEWERGGKQGEKPTLEAAEDRARQFYAMRFVVNMTAPTSPKFGLKPEAQLAVDTYRRYTREGTVDGKTPTQRYLDDFPNWYLFVGGSSANTTGINPTFSAERNRKRYAGVIQQVVNIDGFGEEDAAILGLLVNNPNDNEFYDLGYTAQQGTDVASGTDIEWRGSRDVKTAFEAPYISKGWQDFSSMNDILETAARSRGFESLQDDQVLMGIRSQFTKQLGEQNPAWYSEYLSTDRGKYEPRIKALQVALADPQFAEDKANDPTWDAVRVYLQGRDVFNAELERRNAAGGAATITAKGNADLQRVYYRWVSALSAQAPGFSPVFDRYFDGEFGRRVDEQAVLG